ncbi:MAG: DUF2007 domain-containing protein [Clostridiales bacterium]|nr:DUF2007 domain-containing protein [Clostridiales bacterium]
MNTDPEKVNIVKLKSIENGIELSMIKGLLNDNDIPFIIRYKDAGGHMRIVAGSSLFFGADIMVVEDDYGRAKNLLGPIGFG